MESMSFAYSPFDCLSAVFRIITFRPIFTIVHMFHAPKGWAIHNREMAKEQIDKLGSPFYSL